MNFFIMPFTVNFIYFLMLAGMKLAGVAVGSWWMATIPLWMGCSLNILFYYLIVAWPEKLAAKALNKQLSHQNSKLDSYP